ncbi:hypothetical protein [Shinella sp.]|uniref:hypothetical protein n=1 Tax=Shinella sp. TaxID=1870904 RepID=UPI00258327DA|nr:hypothetical protein [Shinella sp.]MCW5710685.1 hypothetical protein [Shinella sp.]
MENEDVLFPFEFHLMGTPISLQAKSTSKERWKSAVAEAARLRVVGFRAELSRFFHREVSHF